MARLGHLFSYMTSNVWKDPYAVCGQCRTKSACTFTQADMGFRCPLTESMDTVIYIDEQRMPTSDCTYSHADLDLRYLHMT